MSTSPRSPSTPPKRPRRAGRRTRRWACCGTSSASCPWSRSRRSAAGPAERAANWRWPATCGSPRGRTPSWDRSRSAPGTTPGAGGVQHLARLLGRGRAMEAILGADDFDAEQAERYGWINRALPDPDLDAFVARLARRIASFPTDAVRSAKRALNELTLPGADAIRADARRFHQLVISDTAHSWSSRTRPRPARPPCSRRAYRPAAHSNSTSATASEPLTEKQI